MLMEMRSRIEGCRTMILAGAAAADLAERHPDAEVRRSEHDFLRIPASADQGLLH